MYQDRLPLVGLWRVHCFLHWAERVRRPPRPDVRRPRPLILASGNHSMRHTRTYLKLANVSLSLISPYAEPLAKAFLKVTLGITALEYAQRRSKLASKLPRNGIAIISASDVKFRSNAVFYEFQQDSNFLYFTGTVPVVGAFAYSLKLHRLQWTRCSGSHRWADETTISVGMSSVIPGQSADGNDHVFHLFVRPKDPKAERWDGARSGLDAARDVFNADEVRLNLRM